MYGLGISNPIKIDLFFFQMRVANETEEYEDERKSDLSQEWKLNIFSLAGYPR